MNRLHNNIKTLIIVTQILFVILIACNSKLIGQCIFRETRGRGKTEIEAVQKAKLKAISYALLDYGIRKGDLPDSLIIKIGSDPDYFIQSEKIIKKRYFQDLQQFEIVLSIGLSREKIVKIKERMKNRNENILKDSLEIPENLYNKNK
ncbi:MAG: hypothetical protein M1480_10585 [Bacteroidetes bacterium]|nr:hypothetical protein [Bacteroidota bacterium]